MKRRRKKSDERVRRSGRSGLGGCLVRTWLGSVGVMGYAGLIRSK